VQVPTFATTRKVALLIFGLALAAWEIVVRFGQDPAVLVFLAMCLGFQPAKNLDVLLRQNRPTPQTPAPDPDPAPQKPVPERSAP